MYEVLKMAKDTNIWYCKIFGTSSPFFGTKEINHMGFKKRRNKSSITTNTTKELYTEQPLHSKQFYITILEKVFVIRQIALK